MDLTTVPFEGDFVSRFPISIIGYNRTVLIASSVDAEVRFLFASWGIFGGGVMAAAKFGELVPVNGGDPIPLMNETMSIGRRDSCDICLKFQNISSNHCELSFLNGFWSVRDLQSANGTKIKGERIPPHAWRPLPPGEELRVATHAFTVEYECLNPAALEEAMTQEENIFGQSLMEKAGIQKPKKPTQ